MHLLPTVLTFIPHHTFQYVNLFLVGINETLFILCLIVCLGFDVLDLVLQICHSTLIYLLRNYPGPFILFVILVWNGCTLASNGFILASFLPLDTLLLHFYPLLSCHQGFSFG